MAAKRRVTCRGADLRVGDTIIRLGGSAGENARRYLITSIQNASNLADLMPFLVVRTEGPGEGDVTPWVVDRRSEVLIEV